MKVIQVIQSKMVSGKPGPHPEPTEVTYYRGDDHAQALSALVQAAAVTDSKYVAILSVRIEF